MSRTFWVYILTNQTHSVLYTGMTGNLPRRVYEHKEKLVPGFTAKYQATELVHAEPYNRATEAIAREKQIKGGSRAKKIVLIQENNPEWKDLSFDFV